MTEFGHVPGRELIWWHHGSSQAHAPNVIRPGRLFTVRKWRERPGFICTHRHVQKRAKMIITADHWTAGLDHSKFAQVKTLKPSQHNPCIKSSIFSVQKHSAVKVLIHDSCQCSSKRSSTVLKVQTALTFESTASDYNLLVCIDHFHNCSLLLLKLPPYHDPSMHNT